MPLPGLRVYLRSRVILTFDPLSPLPLTRRPFASKSVIRFQNIVLTNLDKTLFIMQV